ncbi:MAG: nicotinate-nucleotide adenylyltransferase [Cyanobacteria bacterium REEB67]|nr:nicotinate-nucleotide adenylyltransferase [Cyanobacteria bacterium REEB67]
MNEIGLFCGTFNPIHLGHLLIAECARDQFKLAKVIFVTSPMPPHRSGGLLPGWDRHAMVVAAIAGNENFEASTVELERPGPSYTIDTVKQIRSLYNDDVRISLIIGGDNVPFLKEWHHANELTTLCRLLVAPRLRYASDNIGQTNGNKNGGENTVLKTIEDGRSGEGGKGKINRQSSVEAQAANLPGADLTVIDFPGIAISASTIRKRIEAGQSVLYMVPPSVNKIIIAKKYFMTESKKP